LNQHTFYIPTDVLTTETQSWCYKCRKFFDTCKEAAVANGLRVVDGLYSEKIHLLCDNRGHGFNISYSKKLNSLSCADCRREEREEWKEQLKQEDERRNELYTKK
jgi:hypothetical protein